MAETTHFEIVSPERVLVSRDVEMAVIPGEEGLFAAMPRHAPMISTLDPGVIEIHEGGSVAERIFVSGGFAEVTPERCTVLAQEALGLDSIDRQTVETELANLKDDLAEATEERHRETLTERIRIAEAKIKAAA